MKIIQIPRRFVVDQWGGSETFITETSSRLQERGITAEIMTTTALCETPEEVYRGIRIRRFPYFYPYLGLSPQAKEQLDQKAGNLFSFSLLRALSRERDVDIIHLNTGKRLGSIGRYAARRRKIPYVISLHGGKLTVPKGESDTWTEPTKGAFEWGKILGFLYGSRKVLEDAAAIICVGRDEYTAISRKYPKKRVKYLPNGVDLKRFAQGDGTWFRTLYKIPEDRFLILNVARIDPQKNQLSLVRQLPDILDKAPDVHLLCIGNVTSNQYYEEVLKEIAIQKLEDRITIIPGIPYESPDLINAYKAADCFVLPSLHEPFGMVVLEAWASGLPVAAAKRGGLPYIIEHGKNGLLFDPEAPARFSESVKEAILALALDEQARERYAKAGFDEATSTYSWDMITDTLVELYREIYEDTVRK
ncbi:MAG: glycosyltransferase family 4 protein [Spirochaetia bacterium]|nr:glycosyltransferase family 4 protein [Spirochaetia bacterium]MCF7942134.1 glycosyltransferase family 4 protein [Spirochaetia bacterium]